jgi:hypothetical protein
MNRPRLIVLSVIGIVLLFAVGTWISNRTEWVEHTMPLPPKGEAATNPFYAAQRFAEQLGATTSWDRFFDEPSPDAVIVLSTWQWSLSASRRLALQRWVENGGRLVVDNGIWGGVENFERWSGIVWEPVPVPPGEDEEAEEDDVEHDGEKEGKQDAEQDDEHAAWVPKCDELREERDGKPVTLLPALSRRVCMHAVRVRMGRGSVTVINAMPFRVRGLFDGDHAWLLVTAAQLTRGDEIHFLSEDEYPSLIALAWMRGWPVAVLSGLVVVLLLWRGAVRFGPLVAPPTQARRSLAEQIRGTGQFVLRGGGAAALHAACVRALEETVRKRVKGFGSLSGEERTEALASVIGDRGRAESLAAALYGTDATRGSELRRTLARIETARRHVIEEGDTRSSQGAVHERRH